MRFSTGILLASDIKLQLNANGLVFCNVNTLNGPVIIRLYSRLVYEFILIGLYC